jgi:hypothetical protein
LRGRISLPKGETARDLIEAGRRHLTMNALVIDGSITLGFSAQGRTGGDSR